MELSQIIEKVNLTTNNPNGGNYTTEDYVFCDTTEDVENQNSGVRIAYNTDYAVMNYGLLSDRREKAIKIKNLLRIGSAPPLLLMIIM